MYHQDGEFDKIPTRWHAGPGCSGTIGVKQGCVLALPLFVLSLSAILKVAFEGIGEGIYNNTRHDASLSVPSVQIESRYNKMPCQRDTPCR